jgi:hypothetical protein
MHIQDIVVYHVCKYIKISISCRYSSRCSLSCENWLTLLRNADRRCFVSEVSMKTKGQPKRGRGTCWMTGLSQDFSKTEPR